MKVVYDPQPDSLALIFRDDPVAESDEIQEGIVVDYSREEKIVSVKILNASEHVSDLKGISYEIKTLEPA